MPASRNEGIQPSNQQRIIDLESEVGRIASELHSLRSIARMPSSPIGNEVRAVRINASSGVRIGRDVSIASTTSAIAMEDEGTTSGKFGREVFHACRENLTYLAADSVWLAVEHHNSLHLIPHFRMCTVGETGNLSIVSGGGSLTSTTFPATYYVLNGGVPIKFDFTSVGQTIAAAGGSASSVPITTSTPCIEIAIKIPA